MKKIAGCACVILPLALWSRNAPAETSTGTDYARLLERITARRCEQMLVPPYHGENLELRLPSVTCMMLRTGAAEPRPLIAVPSSLLLSTGLPTPPAPAPAPPLQLGLGTVLTSGDGLRVASLQLLNLIGAKLLADAVDRHATVEKDWRTQQDVLVLRTDIGRFRPFVEMSYLVVDPRGAQFFYIDGEKSAYYFGGTSYDLGCGFAVSIGASVVGGNPTFFTGAVRLAIPLGPAP